MSLYPKNNIFSHDKKKWTIFDYGFRLISQVNCAREYVTTRYNCIKLAKIKNFYYPLKKINKGLV